MLPLGSRHSAKPIVVSCLQCLLSFLWKTASFCSCLSVSKGSSNDVASAAMTAPVPSVSRLFLASASSTLGSTVVPGTLHDSPAQVLVDSGESENFVDLDVCARLNLPVNLRWYGDRSAIGMASLEISV